MVSARVVIRHHGGTSSYIWKNRPAIGRCQYRHGDKIGHYGGVFDFSCCFQGNLKEIPAIIADKKAITYIALSGVAGALSWLFYFLALKFGNVSQVAPIDKLSVVIATVIAVTLLGEKISILGGAGVALIALGAILVALG